MQRLLRCSTPYGIKGTIATGRLLHRWQTTCAQRLTASKERSQFVIAQLKARGIVCSTPYGIKGTIAGRNSRCRSCARRAQRLTASKERSRGDRQCRQNFVNRAQRLTASKERSLFTSPEVPLIAACSTPYGIKGTIAVNAGTSSVKKYWCSTPYGIKGTIASGYSSGSDSARMCSTPYGIKGMIA